jgi:hypothetical protein
MVQARRERADLGIWQNVTLFASALASLYGERDVLGAKIAARQLLWRGHSSRRTAEEQAAQHFWPTSITDRAPHNTMVRALEIL